MSARVRLGALVVATMTLLAFATAAEQRELTVTPAAETTADAPARHVGAIWPCTYFKPHTGDPLPWLAAWNNESNPYVDTADCAVNHPGGGTHLYCIVEWHHNGNGTPINPVVYTWNPNGWC